MEFPTNEKGRTPFKNYDVSQSLSGDEVVISGISGMFPKSENVKEFMDNLYNKVDMVTPVDSYCDSPEVPQYQGKVKGFDKFDSQFFRVTYKQGVSMDPMSRKLMEHAYSAIYDAGINPLYFNGKKLGVFIGTQNLDTVDIYLYEKTNSSHFFLSGCSKAMMPNRISYWIDGKATSYSVDFACASSLACLEHACSYIKSGLCDAAIVGGSNLCILPTLSVNIKRAGLLCLDGKTKSFNKNGDGYVRSDATNVILLQRARDAKRIYAQICHAKIGYSLSQGDELSLNRNPKKLKKFFEEFYSDIDVSPEEVEYVEANAAGIATADLNEMEAIGDVFGNKFPIKIGSVKSNMGNSEPASGLCSLIKVCLAYQTGKIPGNIHCTDPRDIVSTGKETISVLTDNEPFQRGFTAINNFSITGIDVHVLLKGCFKPKDDKRYETNIPYLITVSGRQEESVDKVLKSLESQTVDAELIALLHNIYHMNTPSHTSRGYIILDKNENDETVALASSISHYPGSARPICFVYSGMGSQWLGMGSSLMQIPIFRNAINKCQEILLPRGVDIIKILTDTDKNIFNNILHSFVGITAVQIGLTDILKELGIVPDFMIGHSLGEMGCAYADGCLTTEETILTSYCRGLASLQTKFIPGAMAAVGLGYADLANMVPPEIDIACHNSSESSTISGPVEVIAKFVKQLKNQGIFAKEVPTNGISYHSRYTAIAGPALLSGLKEVIKDPKPRSNKWLCTSIPREKWDDEIAKYSSPEYHVNNLLSPVLFEETCELIPANAVIIEIAPHGLMQAILKRSHAECANIALTKRGDADPIIFLLKAIGKIYESGIDPKISELYPKVEFPVSTTTPLLSHMVHWDHNETWPVIQNMEKKKVVTGSREFVMSIHDDEYSFLKNYVRNGINVFPESALLVLVWETLAMTVGVNYKLLPVVFSNIKFHYELIIDPSFPLKLTININKNENRFEIYCKGNPVVSGFIKYYRSEQYYSNNSISKSDLVLCTQDIYKILHQRGYAYTNEFQSIYSANIDFDKGKIKWKKEWITFIDGLIQLNILANGAEGSMTPKLIQELKIDVYKQETTDIHQVGDDVCLNADLDTICGVTRCGGVELKETAFQNYSLPQKYPVLNEKVFFSYFPTNYYELTNALAIHLQVINENIPKKYLKITEYNPENTKSLLDCINRVAKDVGINVNADTTTNIELHNSGIGSDDRADVVLVHDFLQNKENTISFLNKIPKESFIWALETNSHSREILINKYFTIVSAIRIGKTKILYLIRRSDNYISYGGIACVKVDNYYKSSWLKQIHSNLSSKKRVVLLSVNQTFNGVTGIVRSLIKEYGSGRVSLVIINDLNAPIFDQDDIFYKEQLQKRLLINVLQKGKWGGFYGVPSTQCANIKNYALSIDVPADFNSFRWCEITPPSSTRTIKVHYAGISKKDVLKAQGIDVSKDMNFGMNFSGVDNNGNRVMGLVAEGAISDTVVADPNFLWPVPDHWTMSEAATIPLAFVHAYYCLTLRAKLYQGVPVVINGGAGALGQALISLCLANGHKVFTTVSNVEKKKLLLKLYPELKEDQIYSSVSEKSALLIKHALKNQRRSVVINCTSGLFREELMTCVGTMGYFLDICQDDIKKNEKFGMNFVDWDRNYAAVDLSNIFKQENVTQRTILQALVSKGIATGEVKPLTSIEYTPQEISRAFKFLSSRKHIGSVLINMLKAIPHDVSPKIICSSEKTFVVVCDQDELGLEITDSIIKRGATKIVLNLRTGCKPVSGYCKYKLNSWKKQNVHVKLVFDDVETEESCSNIFNTANILGPIEGIFIVLSPSEEVTNSNHLIMELEDFSEKFNKASMGIINLELASRYSTFDTLRYFAVITQSSNYIIDEYLYSVSEEICRARNAVGLPGLILQAKFNSEIGPRNIAAVFRGLEKSLQLQLASVQVFDVDQHVAEDSLVAKSDIIQQQITTTTETNNLALNKFKARTYAPDSIGLLPNLDRGFGTLFTFIDDDVYSATDPFVTMSTKVVNAVQDGFEIDPNATHLMLIPGFEGHHKIFEVLCQRLKIKAFTIQLDPDMKNDSIQQMAEDILKLLRARLVLKGKFYLLGYSFGVNIALELTALLEEQGLTGIVYCLDSSPDVLRAQLDSNIGQLSDTQLQNSIIEHIFNLIKKSKAVRLNEDILEMNDWDTKIEYFMRHLKGINYSHQYIRCFLDSAYKRILLARNHNPSFNLNSQLVLIKGAPNLDSDILPQDYNLSKYTKHPIKVFTIESETVLAPFDCRVPNIVNKMLEPELLHAFQDSSSCEIYFDDNYGVQF